MLSRSEVVSSFKALLLREPESENTINELLKLDNLETLIRVVTNSIEYMRRVRPGALWHYTAAFDPVDVVLAYENHGRVSVPDHRVNFLGVAVNVDRFFPELKLENIVESAPIPANWHTDIAELSAALRAVDFAKEEFSMVELGCGWGCWMNITGMAARQRGKRVSLIGVEGDEGHIEFAHEALATNGFSPEQYALFHGVATGQRAGTAFFPRQERSGSSWGLEPIFGATAEQSVALSESGKYDTLRMIPIGTIIQDRPRVDLLHLDIQGGETALLRESLDILNSKVAYLVVGTHSRIIDGEVMELLLSDGGWALEIERPTIYAIGDRCLTTRIDGIQGWRNRRQ